MCTDVNLVYVVHRAILEDISWLGFEWDAQRHASDRFEAFYQCARRLISVGKAYICDLNADRCADTAAP
jgi:glutaminyl-tRNA synthetase